MINVQIQKMEILEYDECRDNTEVDLKYEIIENSSSKY